MKLLAKTKMLLSRRRAEVFATTTNLLNVSGFEKAFLFVCFLVFRHLLYALQSNVRISVSHFANIFPHPPTQSLSPNRLRIDIILSIAHLLATTPPDAPIVHSVWCVLSPYLKGLRPTRRPPCREGLRVERRRSIDGDIGASGGAL